MILILNFQNANISIHYVCACLKKLPFILYMLFAWAISPAQVLTVSGVVSGSGRVQDGVLIDIYEYNSPIQTLHTDLKGYFSFPIIKGKEYIIVVYKSGFISQSFSLSDSKQNPIASYNLAVDMERDEKSSDGLYFKQPVRRIAPDLINKYFIDSKFSMERIKPQKRADSVLVLLNRAQANQYILVGNMKLGSSDVVTKYSRQVEAGIRKEMAAVREKMKQNIDQYDSVYRDEDRHQKATMTTTGDKQLDEITESQRLLAERLTVTTDHYLLEQQQMLSQARLEEIEGLKYKQEMESAKDSTKLRQSTIAYKRSTSRAVNDRYRAMDANRKFQLYNKYQEDQYQEYIELLRYKNQKRDAAKATVVQEVKTKMPIPRATITPADTSDNLSKLSDDQRTVVIQKALEEEERFKNYKETTTQKGDLSVKDIHIADDDYEMQVDKKGNTKYFKNKKPVTKITFEFETKRRFVDVLNTIRQVDKFGK
jgi:hypothetical protein